MVFEKYSLNHRLSLNLMSLNQDCTVLLLKGFNPIVSTINTWYIVVARAINDAVGAP